MNKLWLDIVFFKQEFKTINFEWAKNINLIYSLKWFEDEVALWRCYIGINLLDQFCKDALLLIGEIDSNLDLCCVQSAEKNNFLCQTNHNQLKDSKYNCYLSKLKTTLKSISKIPSPSYSESDKFKASSHSFGWEFWIFKFSLSITRLKLSVGMSEFQDRDVVSIGITRSTRSVCVCESSTS